MTIQHAIIIDMTGCGSFTCVYYQRWYHLPSYSAAVSFTTKRPYFAKLLHDHEWWVIPTHFYEAKISSTFHELYLVTLKGKFKVSLVKLNYSSSKMMSKGWTFFRDSHDLNIDDSCIFELVKKNTMDVYIFRSK
ncbi:hypothetical protein OROMI_016962 [Orobanche minor]